MYDSLPPSTSTKETCFFFCGVTLCRFLFSLTGRFCVNCAVPILLYMLRYLFIITIYANSCRFCFPLCVGVSAVFSTPPRDDPVHVVYSLPVV